MKNSTDKTVVKSLRLSSIVSVVGSIVAALLVLVYCVRQSEPKQTVTGVRLVLTNPEIAKTIHDQSPTMTTNGLHFEGLHLKPTVVQ